MKKILILAVMTLALNAQAAELLVSCEDASQDIFITLEKPTNPKDKIAAQIRYDFGDAHWDTSYYLVNLQIQPENAPTLYRSNEFELSVDLHKNPNGSLNSVPANIKAVTNYGLLDSVVTCRIY